MIVLIPSQVVTIGQAQIPVTTSKTKQMSPSPDLLQSIVDMTGLADELTHKTIVLNNGSQQQQQQQNQQGRGVVIVLVML